MTTPFSPDLGRDRKNSHVFLQIVVIVITRNATNDVTTKANLDSHSVILFLLRVKF